MEILPIAVVVLFWLILFVAVFVFYARSLRLPTEPELEAALEETHSH